MGQCAGEHTVRGVIEYCIRNEGHSRLVPHRCDWGHEWFDDGDPAPQPEPLPTPAPMQAEASEEKA
jgi:hypothetical protein